MVMSGIALLVVLGIGYTWLTRGFFSSLIHLVCTVIAGAIAFALWEHVSLAILNAAADRGFTSFLRDVAWGLGLALPFGVSLAILRVIVDKLLPANVTPGHAADYAGGAICGLGAGVISAGILTISIGFLRMETGFFGATHVSYNNTGNVVRSGGLMLPVDRITVALYGKLSEQAFSTGEPLAKWHPRLDEMPAAMRMNFGDGKARNTIKAQDFKVVSRFTVGQGGSNLQDLFNDRWNTTPQTVVDADGKAYPPGSYIEGFVVNFLAGSKEKEGKTTIGAGQLSLVVENEQEGTRTVVYPIAVSSQAESTGQAGFARWRYDARDTFIASVGGASEAIFAFEFVVPPGYAPTALYVRGIRHVVGEGATAQPSAKFTAGAQRDGFISSLAAARGGALPGADGSTAAAGADLDTSQSTRIEWGRGTPGQSQVGAVAPPGVEVTNAIGFVIQKGTHDPLVIDEENNRNLLVEGEKAFEPDYAQKTTGMERSLRIERFAVTDDTVIVKVDVSLPSRTSLLGQAAASVDRILPPLLIDTNGQSYQPVGFIYKDSTKVQVRYTPGQPIRALSETPSLSRSRPDQQLTLIYRVSLGVSVNKFVLGNKVIAEFDPPVPLLNRQTGR
jgi:hypothetical protein